jgi:hypothetical protein
MIISHNNSGLSKRHEKSIAQINQIVHLYFIHYSYFVIKYFLFADPNLNIFGFFFHVYQKELKFLIIIIIIKRNH